MPPKSGLITIRDVALEAGVSHAVVSTVLRNRTGSNVRVSHVTRQRVLDVARRMNFKPSVIARGLREQRSFLVGLILRDVNLQISGDLIRGLNEFLKEHDYSPLVHVSSSALEEAEGVERSVDRRVDGLIVNATQAAERPTHASWMDRIDVPVVELFGDFIPGVPSLEVDFEADGAAAAQHLIDLGHRQIGLLIHERYKAGEKHPTAEKFALGYHTAIQNAGLQPVVFTHELTRDDQWEEQFVAGAQRCFERIRQHPARVTGIVCYSDYQAYGILRAARLAGVRIPEDLSVTGHYDLEISRVVSPTLTSLRIATRAIGELAGEMMLQLIEGKKVETQKLASQLIHRETTCAVDR